MRFLTLSLLFFFSGGLAAQGAIPAFEFDHRIALTVDRLTDLDRRPAFTQDFILADVDLTPANPRRFYNFSGDLSGRYIEVMSLLPPEKREAIGLEELVAKALEYQQADGRFGDPSLVFSAEEIGGEHMALLWGNGRFLIGLMTYYERTKDPVALATARKLGDFFISTAAACQVPAVREKLMGFGAKGIICFTQYIEGLVPLARATGDQRYTAAAKDAYQILPERGIQHSHGYLTTLRGALMLYELTGEATTLAYVKTTFDDLLLSEDYTVYGAVNEYFGGHGDRDEGCSTADFLRLAFQLHALTGEDRYLEVGEKALVNALYLNQYSGGDFGHNYFASHGMAPSNPRRSWWCCTMHGLRTLLDVKENYSLRRKKKLARIQLLVDQQYDDGALAYELERKVNFAEKEQYALRITRWEPGLPLEVQLPNWADNWELITTEGAKKQIKGSLLRMEEFEVGKTYTLQGNLKTRFHAKGKVFSPADFPDEPTAGYLTYGPYLLVVRQDDFVGEPDWAHQISLQELTPDPEWPYSLRANYRHGGYPGMNPVRLEPVGQQPYFDHAYARLFTNYSLRIVPVSPD